MQFFKQGSDPQQRNIHRGLFPIILTPNGQSGVIQLQEHVEKHRQELLKKVSEVGAVVVRGFDIQNANEYVSVLHKLGLAEFEYIGGAAVRHLIIGTAGKPKSLQVFTTNESPPNEPIPLHNELAQNENYPEYVSFYCDLEAEKGGSTPIINCHHLYNYIEKHHKDFVVDLEAKGVKYVRIVEQEDNPASPIGRGWRNIFNVKDKEEAQAKMKQSGYEWQWLESTTNDCRLSSKALPAIRIAKNGEKVFCNQLIAVFKGWIDHKNNPSMCLKYGDGSDMPINVLEDIAQFGQKEVAAIPWKKGDFVLIDNEVVAHSRQPFQGPRCVYACLMQGKSDVRNGPRLTLRSGDLMPVQGFGTWKIDKKICAQTVLQALKKGYRLLDCACDYGNETEVGDGIKLALEEGVVKRQELFVTSKLWNTFHRKEHVREACLKTLKDLKLEYVDLYLIHFPISLKYVPFETRYPPEWFHDPNAKNRRMIEDPVPILQTWSAMVDLVKEGLVRNIGVCNFNTSLLRELINSHPVKPSVLQVELHPQLTQKKLIRFCRQYGIQMTSYSTFGATSYVELGGAKMEEAITEGETVKKIAKETNKTPHQVVLRWAVQQGIAIIPKSVNPDRMLQNHDVSGWSLNETQMAYLDNLNKNKRYNDPGVFCEGAFNTFFPIYD